MNLPPLHKLGGPVCPPCTPTAPTTPSAPTDVSVHELLLLAEERDRLKAEQELALQLQRASLQGGEADAEPPALPDADSSIECAICLGSLLKGSGDAPYPPQSLRGGAYGRPYVTVCANGHLFHKECIKRHLANDDPNIGLVAPSARRTSSGAWISASTPRRIGGACSATSGSTPRRTSPRWWPTCSRWAPTPTCSPSAAGTR